MDLKWVGCQYPTAGARRRTRDVARASSRTSSTAPCLLDWDAERERMSRYARALRRRRGGAHRRRAAPTSASASPAARTEIDAGGANMPGGEFFCSPVEDSAEGEIVFGEFPAVYAGREVTGIALRFEGGRVVEALGRRRTRSSSIEMLDLDDGRAPARRARHRLQPGHHALHEEHALRREDRRHRPSRARQRASRGSAARTSASVHWDIVRDCDRAPGGTDRARRQASCRNRGAGRLVRALFATMAQPRRRAVFLSVSRQTR